MHPVSNFTVGYIPTGSSNDLARNLSIPREPLAALDLILSGGTVTPLDIGLLQYENSLQKRRFLVSCGIGFDAAVCAEAMASPIKDTLNRIGLGKLTYLGIALKQLLTAPRVSCDFWLDDTEAPIHLNKFFFLASMNHRYEGGGFMFCPTADWKDEIFDICCVGNLSKLLILIALPTAFWGKHYLFKGVTSYRAHKIRIQTGAPLWVHTDGETQKQSCGICLSQEKEKLQIIS